MAKKARVVTNFQAALRRLEYLSAKKNIMQGYLLPDCKDKIAVELGLMKKTLDNGETKYVYVDESYKSMSDVYSKAYADLAKQLNEFYKAMESLPSERLKEICERHIMEGESLKDIADDYEISLPTMYAHRDVIVDVLKSKNCLWVLKSDVVGYV